MYKIYKTLIILILIIFSNANVAAQEKIKYINLDLIVKNTNAGKLILANLENKKNENIKNFKEQEDKIIEDEQDLAAKKNILSEEEFNSKLAELKKKLKKYKSEKQKKINEFENNKKKLINNFFKQINPLIEDYVKINSIDIVISKNNVFIASKKLDITNDIIEIIDEKIK
tara:strand:+ start:114 stop:626 length:513 start_codon:yes stop_codon:yes gene_type:complete